jgi:hypothetical protein
MIENLRKYNGLIILGLVTVFIALVIGLQSSAVRNSGGGKSYIKVAGRSYDAEEYKHLGSNALEVLSSLANPQTGDFSIYMSISGLISTPDKEYSTEEKFFIGRMLIREAKETYGVHPDEQQISDFIRAMKPFSDTDKKFSSEKYRRFVEKGIGRLGMTDNDFREIVSDLLAIDQIRKIVGSGLGANPKAIQHISALDSQQIDGTLGRLDITSYKNVTQPTDAELKAYWELIQDNFKTEPLRKFTYIIATPDMPKEEAKTEEPKDSIIQAAKSDAVKAVEKKVKDDKAAAIATERRKAQTKVDSLIDDFTYILEEQKGTGFEDLAKKNGLEVKTTELVGRNNAPEELKAKLRNNSQGGTAVDELFLIQPTGSDEVSKISQPIAMGDTQWLVARLDGEEKSRTKTFDEAKVDVLAQYISENSAKALKKAADETAEKLKSAIASGKSFEDAARDAGIAETHTFSKVTASYRPDPLSEPTNLFKAASTLDPKSTSAPIIQADSAYIIYVANREVVKLDSDDTRFKAQLDTNLRQNEACAFTDWITAQTNAAKVERFYRAQ